MRRVPRGSRRRCVAGADLARRAGPSRSDGRRVRHDLRAGGHRCGLEHARGNGAVLVRALDKRAVELLEAQPEGGGRRIQTVIILVGVKEQGILVEQRMGFQPAVLQGEEFVQGQVAPSLPFRHQGVSVDPHERQCGEVEVPVGLGDHGRRVSLQVVHGPALFL